MSNKPYKGFEPKWLLTPAPAGSYRSIFRWGDPAFFKYPKESLYKMMKEAFHMTDDDFRDYTDDIGFDQVSLPDHPPRIAPEHLEALKKIVGEEFVTTGDYERLSVAYGCTGYDLLRLRHKQIDSLPDVVVYPDTTEQVEELVRYAAEHKLPLYVYGGGSSVTRGVEPIKGGISLDMRKRFNKILSFNEVDQTITVQAGLSGPALEEALQDAPNRFGAKRQYTCGHFPQSFEYSSVGGCTRRTGGNGRRYTAAISPSPSSTAAWAAGWSPAARARTAPTMAPSPISSFRRSTPPPSAASSLPIIPGRPPAPISTRS